MTARAHRDRHNTLLRRTGQGKDGTHPACRDRQMEALVPLAHGPCATGAWHLRHIPHHVPSRRRDRRGSPYTLLSYREHLSLDGRRYPWGNEWDFKKANSASYWAGRTIDFQSGADWDAFWVKGEGATISKKHGIKGEVLTMQVASFPEGASPYGLYDMAGNVAEWVQDWYNSNYYREAPLSDPQGPPRGAIKAMRGGSWLKPAISLRTSDRDWGTMDSRPSGTGFRCAMDIF